MDSEVRRGIKIVPNIVTIYLVARTRKHARCANPPNNLRVFFFFSFPLGCNFPKTLHPFNLDVPCKSGPWILFFFAHINEKYLLPTKKNLFYHAFLLLLPRVLVQGGRESENHALFEI